MTKIVTRSFCLVSINKKSYLSWRLISIVFDKFQSIYNYLERWEFHHVTAVFSYKLEKFGNDLKWEFYYEMVNSLKLLFLCFHIHFVTSNSDRPVHNFNTTQPLTGRIAKNIIELPTNLKYWGNVVTIIWRMLSSYLSINIYIIYNIYYILKNPAMLFIISYLMKIIQTFEILAIIK